MWDHDERITVVSQGCVVIALAAMFSALAGVIAGGITGSLYFGATYAVTTFGMVWIVGRLEPYMIIITTLFWPVMLVIAILMAVGRSE